MTGRLEITMSSASMKRLLEAQSMMLCVLCWKASMVPTKGLRKVGGVMGTW